MQIKFYYNSSEKNKIGKSLSKELTMNGNLRNECSVINPTILVNASSLIGYNYCYIKEFQRYYFITDVVSVRNNLWRVSLAVDPLETFKNSILNLNCIISKQESDTKSNKMLNDGTYLTTEDSFTEIIQFPNKVGTVKSYLLTHI